jgi:hypothetical protein
MGGAGGVRGCAGDRLERARCGSADAGGAGGAGGVAKTVSGFMVVGGVARTGWGGVVRVCGGLASASPCISEVSTGVVCKGA